MSNSSQPHGLWHTRLPCPSLSPGVCWNSCPSSWCCHPTISFSAAPFSCPESFPASGSFPVSQLFASGGQSIGASASVSVLPMNVQGWFPLGLTGLISKGLSRVLSPQNWNILNNTISILPKFRNIFTVCNLHVYHTNFADFLNLKCIILKFYWDAQKQRCLFKCTTTNKERSLHRAYLVGGSVQSISQTLAHNLMRWTSITISLLHTNELYSEGRLVSPVCA